MLGAVKNVCNKTTEIRKSTSIATGANNLRCIERISFILTVAKPTARKTHQIPTQIESTDPSGSGAKATVAANAMRDTNFDIDSDCFASQRLKGSAGSIYAIILVRI